MKIFYCWQTDTPEREGKSFIRGAAEVAIEELAEHPDYTLDERPSLDHDTLDVLGDASILAEILRKIREADIVLADVTITGKTTAGKTLINSNVAFELGYTHATQGFEVILKVMNTSYGEPKALPFDIQEGQGRRWPTRYSLAEGAPRSEYRRVRRLLADEFKKIFLKYAQKAAPAPEKFEPTPATYSPSAYWTQNEPLFIARQIQGNTCFKSHSEPRIFVRIWPEEAIVPPSIAVLDDVQQRRVRPLCWESVGQWQGRNRHGRIKLAGTRQAGAIHAVTQIFENGEIWGTNSFWLRQNERRSPPKVFSIAPLEIKILSSIRQYISVAKQHLGYSGKINLEMGLTDVQDYSIMLPGGELPEDLIGPIYTNDIVYRSFVSEDIEQSPEQLAIHFFEAIFAKAGAERPKIPAGFLPK